MNVQYDFKKSIGQLLLKSGSITEEMLAFTTKVQQVSRERIGDIMMRLRFATDREIAATVAEQSELEYDPMLVVSSSPDALAQIPSNVAQKHGLLPLAIEGEHL